MSKAALLSFLYGVAAYQILHQSVQLMYRKGMFEEALISPEWVKTIGVIACSLPIFYFVIRLGDRAILRISLTWMGLVILYRLFRMSGLSASYITSLFWALTGATLVFWFIHRLLEINSEQERVLLNQLAEDTSGRHSDEFLSHFLDSILSWHRCLLSR